MQRHHDHGGTDTDATGARRQIGRELNRPADVAVRRKVVLSQPDVAEAKLFGLLRMLDCARVHLFRGLRRGRLHQQKRAEIHRRPLPTNGAWSHVKNAWPPSRVTRKISSSHPRWRSSPGTWRCADTTMPSSTAQS